MPRDGGSEPHLDGGEEDAAKAPPGCDGPCPIETLARNLNQATALTLDSKNVYFAIEGGSGAIYQCPKSGCTGEPLELGDGYTFEIAVDATRVYWGDFFGGKIVACTIGGCGGSPTAIAPAEADARGVVSDGTRLYWSSSANGGAVRRCSLAGCTPESVATAQGPVLSLTASQGTALWIANNAAWTCASPPCASPASLGPASHYVSVYKQTVYWVNAPSKTVVMCPLSGCSGAPITIGSSAQPQNPVSDGKHVYWRDGQRHEIYRCPVTGCAPGPELVAKDQQGQSGGGLALDGEYLYWTTSSAVHRVRK